jgi:hypothetical protein
MGTAVINTYANTVGPYEILAERERETERERKRERENFIRSYQYLRHQALPDALVIRNTIKHKSTKANGSGWRAGPGVTRSRTPVPSIYIGQGRD